MLQKLLKNTKGILIIAGCIFAFALLRYFEKELFYDPFLDYFQRDYLDKPFPSFESFKLFWSMFFRYFVNSLFSIIVFYSLFKDKSIIKFTTVLYSLLFVVLISSFFFVVLVLNENYNFLLFYLRRFLIQPLFLVLFIPAFYFQKRQG